MFFFLSGSLNKNSRTYFYTGFLAYIFGLGLTIFVMHTFKHAQVSNCVELLNINYAREVENLGTVFVKHLNLNISPYVACISSPDF